MTVTHINTAAAAAIAYEKAPNDLKARNNLRIAYQEALDAGEDTRILAAVTGHTEDFITELIHEARA